tara:strand:+ start:1327 stop:1725 length:399 start_codon:yes stop_codon:yes gene_type:complete
MANLSALKAGGVPSTFCGYTTLSAADGDVAVTGIGFKPTWIMVVDLFDNSSATSNIIVASGYKNAGGTRQYSRTYKASDGAIFNSAGSNLYYSYDQGANLVSGILKSFDADGFTIDKTGYAFACDIHWIVGR